MFCKIKAFFLTFDIRDGPRIIEEKGSLELINFLKEDLLINAFPESMTPIQSNFHQFCFRSGKKFCHALSIQKENSAAERGYELYSIILIANSSPIWWKLINSAAQLESIPPHDIFELVYSYSTTWSTILYQSKINSISSIELPTFQGAYNYILDHSTINVETGLHVQQLIKFGRLSDVTRLWEAAILDIPILVVGSTPRKASEAVLSIVSLINQNLHLEKKSSRFKMLSQRSFEKLKTRSIVPYITFANPKFLELAKKPKGIVGVSNLMAQEIGKSFPLVYKIGFNDSIGLGPNLNQHKMKQSPSNLASIFSSNTETLRNVSEKYLNSITDPTVLNAKDFSRMISSSRLLFTLDPILFSKFTLKSDFFAIIRLLTCRKQNNTNIL